MESASRTASLLVRAALDRLLVGAVPGHHVRDVLHRARQEVAVLAQMKSRAFSYLDGSSSRLSIVFWISMTAAVSRVRMYSDFSRIAAADVAR
jgi:hypothetical protein